LQFLTKKNEKGRLYREYQRLRFFKK